MALELGPAPDGLSFFLFADKSKKFTKRVAMRAVELSTGAFCTEFRCEQLCDDDIFQIGVKFEIFHEDIHRESCGALDRCILHRISLRTTL